MDEVQGAGSEFGDPGAAETARPADTRAPVAPRIGAPFQKQEHSGESRTMYQQSFLMRHLG
jgi:hypothetical protein